MDLFEIFAVVTEPVWSGLCFSLQVCLLAIGCPLSILQWWYALSHSWPTSVNSFRPQNTVTPGKLSQVFWVWSNPPYVLLLHEPLSPEHVSHPFICSMFVCTGALSSRCATVACSLGHLNLSPPRFLHYFLSSIHVSFLCVIFKVGLGEEVRAYDN